MSPVAVDDTLAPYVYQYVLPAAFAVLPDAMDSIPAEAFLIAIGLQESGFQHRAQLGGPARGFWQFERAGGVRGVLTHRATKGHIERACHALRYSTHIAGALADIELHAAIQHNDILAACFARLLLWTLPDALPAKDEPELAWQQYLSGWRPGKPHPETWDAHYAQAWQLVEP